MAQHKLKGWYNSFVSKIGLRGAILGVTGIGMVVYGIGIFLGYRPVGLLTDSATIAFYRWVFIVVGCGSIVGAFFRDEKLPYAVSVAAVTGWTAILAWYWSAPQGWTSAVSWMIIGAILLVCSRWLDPPKE